ncbi:MAG: hypothetical protein PHO83_03820 [Geobacteraceae bacterium]|nr:hypothetical protein [Geobacteraceae bacterium]
MCDKALRDAETRELARAESHHRDGKMKMEPSESYNQIRCLYCGYAPGLVGGRLNIYLIDGEAAFVCRSCETMLNQQKPEEP